MSNTYLIIEKYSVNLKKIVCRVSKGVGFVGRRTLSCNTDLQRKVRAAECDWAGYTYSFANFATDAEAKQWARETQERSA